MSRDRMPDLAHAPGNLTTAAELLAPDPDGRDMTLALSTQFLFRGRVFTVNFRAKMRAESLNTVCDRLDKLGAEPLPLPVSLSPDGEPICPKHRVPMRPREKQGDIWHSHPVADGVYCKGRAGADSPGWDYP